MSGDGVIVYPLPAGVMGYLVEGWEGLRCLAPARGVDWSIILMNVP